MTVMCRQMLMFCICMCSGFVASQLHGMVHSWVFFYLCTLCISTQVYIMHKSFIYSLLLEVAGTIIDDLFHSKLLTAFSGASASYSQNKPGSQCEVAVTCQSLAKCRYHYEYYVVVGGQYSNIMPLEWEYITYCSGASDSSSYHTLTTHCRLLAINLLSSESSTRARKSSEGRIKSASECSVDHRQHRV